MKVVGGIYSEYCYDPYWRQFFGSGGRGAATLRCLDASDSVELITCLPKAARATVERTLAPYQIKIQNIDCENTYEFRYTHPLSEPQWNAPQKPIHCIGEVKGDVILAYGMLEGYLRLTGQTIVYDPQSEEQPIPIHEVAKSFDRLAVILNEHEVIKLGGDTDYRDAATNLANKMRANVVVIKRGPYGCDVLEGSNLKTIPVYESQSVFKIGTGDVFSAAFAHFWGRRGLSAEIAADNASRCVSLYTETQSIDAVRQHSQSPRKKISATRKPKIYLAGPFFSLSQRFLIEEAKRALEHLGSEVFSPLHDVGINGTSEEIAKKDLLGLNECNAVLALLTDLDVGTVFETGYATAKKIPIVAYTEGVKSEHLTMLLGSGCLCTEDFCTSLYHAVWRAV